ncbi:receptor-type tyrosine-protein phosphatase eta isoform X1 [Phyllopteryx taeniolatus]|uniref:receptor-type tyrosine-protein phosphatase eta isoform X1 n=1 Tax=Phyllopteryx taeniolatus TaxID=161469 RepID=UPI002AD331E7|nr:receptor-type tyrosine-protein phosphatase eta isoform X1 [Phyllopteryx taeniolatus]
MKTSPLRLIASLWIFLPPSVLIKGSHAYCHDKPCDSNETKTTTTTTPPSCISSLGNVPANGTLTGSTSGAADQVSLNCSSCCQQVTMKPEKATNLVVNNFTTSSITVSWTKPEGNYSFYVVQWTDGKVPQKENVTTTSKNITGLSAGTLYDISVTTLADDRVTEGDTASVSQYTKPGIIREPSASTNTSTMSLTWTPPDGEVFMYQVKWINRGRKFTQYTNDGFAVLSDLVSGTSYTVAIVCIAGDNQTEGEGYTFATFTRPERPENITVTPGTDNMNIDWTLLQGRADFYVVNISNTNLLYSCSKNTTVTTANFSGLYPGRVYLITVTAFAGHLSDTSNQISFATFPTPPGSLNISRRTNASLHLRWETPTKMEGAPLISYRIAYQQPGGTMQTANTTNNSTVLSALSSGTLYNVTADTVGPQNLTSSAVHTSAYTLPNPVFNLVSSPFNTTSIKVAWSRPHGARTYYKYLVQTYNRTGILVDAQTVSDNNTDVHDLEPGTKYNVSVSTLATAESQSTEEQTFTYTMPKAVTDLRVQDFNTTAIQLLWDRSSDYKDTYIYLLTAFQDDAVVHNATTKTEMYTVFNLIPGTLYNFDVFTVVAVLKSTSQQTSQYTRPEVVSDIRAIGTTTNMSVSWSAPVGRVDSFTILLNKGSESESSEKDWNSTLSTFFTDLKPGMLYCVAVISKSGHLESDNSTLCNATFPNPPGPIRVEWNNVSSINFTWNVPDDMDGNQYNFSVNAFSTTQNNWFLWNHLDSGTLNSISVATIGVMGYKSTAVTAQIYTRPHSVTRLEAAEITTNSVMLVWEQEEKKPTYFYVVLVTNGLFPPSEEVFRTLYANITGLLSGSNYTFTVFTQAEDGTRSAPQIVSFFTRPYEISILEAHTLNSTAIRLVWMEALRHKSEYTYRVETTGCGSQNKTVAEELAVIVDLNPGTQCTFCVFVQAPDGIEGEARCISQYTMPEAVQLGISSQGSNVSVLVSWLRPAGNVESYSVHLNSSSPAQTQPVKSTDNSVLFKGLSAGRLYSAKVTSRSGPFTASSEYVTNATFPNPPGPIEILTKTANSIEARWTEAPLMDNTSSFYYQLTSAPPEGSEYIDTANTSHTFEPLQSGTPYNISIATVGLLGFRSEVIQAFLVTTKPFHVKFLNTFAEEDDITVTWLQPDEYKESYLYHLTWQSADWPINGTVVTEQTMHTIEKLVPGSRYNFSVICETRDGTRSAPRWISNCTGASPVRNVTCESPDNPNAEIVLSWAKPSGQFNDFRITTNNTEVINGTRTCNQSCSQTISNLSHYTPYNITMETLSCGQPAPPVSRHCRTGVTDPPIPVNYESLASVKEKVYNRFTIQINTSLMVETSGPITHFGVLLTDNIKESGMANMSAYLGKTHQQWLDKQTPVYLATVKERNVQSRSDENMLSVDIGDGSQWEDYTNGALRGNRRYQYAIVLFTRMSLQYHRIQVGSHASITNVYPAIKLPQNPVVISVAVGATLGIFIILFIILIGFIVYWKRLSKKESSDIQIHSMRSAAVRLEDYEAYYKKQKADSNCGFAEEFEELRLVGTCHSKASALIQENKAKNRYNNVLPYDSSRVKLSIIHGSPYDDYINANYMPGHNSKKEFIAAQGPLPITVKDFWRMIWEKNVHTLVMLTRCNEQGRIKCEQYWHSSTKHFEYIRVTTTSEIALDDWTIRDFEIKNVKTAETRSVRQFHFTAWPDHGVPETTELLISFRHLVREHMDQYSTNSPTVVHCSAGVGRTGTFIAIDRLIFQIERENVVDVYGVVHDLRVHRPLMVQTEDQYVFLNQCAMDIIRSRTGTNVDLIYQNTAALSIYENVEPRKGYYKHGYHNT